MLIMSPQILKMVLGPRLYVPVVSLSTKYNLKLENSLMLVIKELKDCLFLLIVMLQTVQIRLILILSKILSFKSANRKLQKINWW